MYSMTLLQGVWLGGAVVVAMVLLVLGVVALFPRAVRAVSLAVYCPLLQRRVRAELARDEWTLRCTDVLRCSVLGGLARAVCNKRCLTGQADDECHDRVAA
jgi:hypothetical protein